MLFHDTTGRAHNQSSPKVSRQPWGFVFAGSSFVLSFFFLIAGALLAAKPQAASQAGAAEARQVTPGGSVVFATQIRPILASRCYPCHGTDIQQHGLRMDSLQAILTGATNETGVIPRATRTTPIVPSLLGLSRPQLAYDCPAPP